MGDICAGTLESAHGDVGWTWGAAPELSAEGAYPDTAPPDAVALVADLRALAMEIIPLTRMTPIVMPPVTQGTDVV